MSSKQTGKTVAYGVLAASLLALGACSDSGKKDNAASPSASAAASGSPAASASPVAALQPVELVYYYPQGKAQNDINAVQDAVNKITKEKINATVKLKPIDFGEYTQKMNTIAASGEAFDLVWTSNWNFDYVQNVSKGVFQPIDDLLAKYGNDVKKALPDFMWEMVKVGGKTYGIPNYQSVTGREGFIIPKEYVDKYKVDISAIKKFDDLEPLLETIKKNEPDKVPLAMSKAGMFGYQINTQGLDTLPITNNPPIGVYKNDAALKLVNVYATPEYKHHIEVMHKWYDKGYISHDAPTAKDTTDLTKSGKGIVSFSLSLNPGTEAAVKTNYGGKDIVYAPTTDFVISGNPGIATVTAISKTSKNPDRAMMLLNLINTDKTLFNTLAFGIEGKHYTKVNDKTIKVNADGGYAPNAAWVVGNTFNGYLVEGQPADTFEVQQKTNASAKPNPTVGFKFDQGALTTEIANVQSVLDEYLPGLNTGAVDPEKKLPEMLDRLNKAGIDKIMQEAQKQVDAWKQTKK